MWSGPALPETLNSGPTPPKYLTRSCPWNTSDVGRTAHCVLLWDLLPLEANALENVLGSGLSPGGDAPYFFRAHVQLKRPSVLIATECAGSATLGTFQWPPGPKPLIACCHFKRMADGNVAATGSGSRSERQLAAPEFLVQARKENLGGPNEGATGLLGPLSEGGGPPWPGTPAPPAGTCRNLTRANGSAAPTGYSLLRSRLTHAPCARLPEGPP